MQKIEKIVIPRNYLGKIVEEALKTPNIEICGLLIGVVKNKVVIVKRIKFTPNVAKSSIRFSIDPKILYETYMEVEKIGEDIVGIFHSHPASPQPSAIDIEYMEINPVVWLIIGVLREENYEIAAWQFFEGKIHNVEIVET